jgi:hypothetical protein
MPALPNPSAVRPTDHRNLNLWKLHEDVCFGQAGGKVIWQPRILAWYDDKVFFKEPLPAPYENLSRADLYRRLGCSDRLYYFNDCLVAHEDPRVRIEQTKLPHGQEQITYHTPVGVQTLIIGWSEHSRCAEIVKRPILDERDMKIAAWRAQRTTWSFDQTKYNALVEELGDLGAPTAYLGRTNIQRLFVEDMGVEQTIFALMDYPQVCDQYFEALEVCEDRLMDVICASPIRIINYGDNFHASITSPDLFRKYILPAYQRRYEKLHPAGKWISSHWDGWVKPLLPLARACALDAIEAITPIPQGDVTLEETKAALGDDLFLMDGLPAIYFNEEYPEQDLIDCVNKCLDLFAPKLILGISDEISATGNIDRVRLVGQIVDDYNASL